MCDEDGVFCLEGCSPGDTLRAEYAGLKSPGVLIAGKKKEYSLRIGVGQLHASVVSGSEVKLLNEYLKLVSHVKVKDLEFVQKFSTDYVVRYSRAVPETRLDDSGKMFIALVHSHDVDDPDDFWTTFGEQVDSISAEGIATSLLYAKELLYYVRSPRLLKADSRDKNILIHKTYSDSGELCYILLEGQKRNNQTVIRFDSNGKCIKDISRAFAGSGTVVTTSPGTIHRIRLLMSSEGRNTVLDGVIMSLQVPEAGDTRTTVLLSSIRTNKSSSAEQELMDHRVQQYLDWRKVHQR